VQRGADGVRRRVCRAGDRAVGFSETNKQISVKKRVFHGLLGFFERDAFGAAQFVKKTRYIAEFGGFSMVNQLDAV
jgi:hypothetical protein